ncbi:hypothetical protein GGTG_12133 [Gaeumannomyces tritici R3-111a-1]|uniref:Uncharacterized protein n=1 Tax=Gaeumannomyces tritici (strain R3-111a-1) TaxID=644352 RepID=J3PF54_GAET3|nr:hypothetical protein GGTG_12133 [Gaeumannomyces tritici R3-111a-1]EJT69956.1 hypothetical protein GGTG_12133 [Gaeumannomyces tritici R3-111a-1]
MRLDSWTAPTAKISTDIITASASKPPLDQQTPRHATRSFRMIITAFMLEPDHKPLHKPEAFLAILSDQEVGMGHPCPAAVKFGPEMSSNVYTPLGDSTYLLLTPFYMPSDKGEIWAVAFSSNSATLVTAGLSVIFTTIFMCLWNIICTLALLCNKGTGRRRFVALVTLWNSNEPWFAFWQMCAYSVHCCSVKISETSAEKFFLNRDRWYGIGAAALAFVVYGAALALGIVGPSLLEIGSVAPARPSILFYPAAATNSQENIQRFGLQAPGSMRALGSVEAAEVTVAQRVVVDAKPDPTITDQDKQMLRMNYGYSLTGVDFGLQHAPYLELAVRGSCVTEYGWLARPARNNSQEETYTLWGGEMNVTIPLGNADIRYAPRVSFINRPAAVPDNGNVSFAIVVAAAHRASISEGSDPWYVTERRPDTAPPTPMNASFWMKPGRPVLSCWQQDSWTHGGQTVYNPGQLNKLPGLNVPTSLLSVLKSAFNVPMLVTLGTASGDSALRSRTTSPNGVIDAKVSSIEGDMRRLIIGSFVASQSVLTDATMYGTGQTYRNALRGPNGQPADGAGDFVISDPGIQTFHLGGMIALVVLLAFLLLLSSIMVGARHVLGPNYNNQSGEEHLQESSVWDRLRVLSAAQLFRCVYEPNNGILDDWRCTNLPGDGGVSLAACDKEAKRGPLEFSTTTVEEERENEGAFSGTGHGSIIEGVF